jgi:hypothetical protein
VLLKKKPPLPPRRGESKTLLSCAAYLPSRFHLPLPTITTMTPCLAPQAPSTSFARRHPPCHPRRLSSSPPVILAAHHDAQARDNRVFSTSQANTPATISPYAYARDQHRRDRPSESSTLSLVAAGRAAVQSLRWPRQFHPRQAPTRRSTPDKDGSSGSSDSTDEEGELLYLDKGRMQGSSCS